MRKSLLCYVKQLPSWGKNHSPSHSFKRNDTVTASLQERPSGRVHWPPGNWDETFLRPIPDGLPPWAPPDSPPPMARNHFNNLSHAQLHDDMTASLSEHSPVRAHCPSVKANDSCLQRRRYGLPSGLRRRGRSISLKTIISISPTHRNHLRKFHKTSGSEPV